MIRIGRIHDPAAVHQRGSLPDGSTISGIHLISSPQDAPDLPHAFLVRQSAQSQLGAHLHLIREFQIVVEGSGRLGRHPVQPFLVHYAAAQAGYGPMVAGDEGLGYLTLRQAFEHGVLPLPENRHLLGSSARQRQKTAEPPAETDFPSVAADSTVMLEPDETGLGAWLMRLPANAMVDAPAGEGSADRYHVVMRGGLRISDAACSSLSVIWYSADEPIRKLQAGPSGAVVLIVQFPHPGIAS